MPHASNWIRNCWIGIFIFIVIYAILMGFVDAKERTWTPCRTEINFCNEDASECLPFVSVPDWAVKKEKTPSNDPIWMHGACNEKTHEVLWCGPTEDAPSKKCRAVAKVLGITP